MQMINKSNNLLLVLSLLIVVVPSYKIPKKFIITATSSTEAEFLTAVSCAKIPLYLQSILYELGFKCKESTPIYKDNASTILIVNSSAPTEHG